MKYSAFLFLALAACSTVSTTPQAPGPTDTTPDQPPSERTGILVMAHGGDAEWNRSVEAALRPLAATSPTALAFGMANPYTLQAGLDDLHDQGVARVAVVRMFLSGESFLDQTEYFLGLSQAPPEHFVLMGPAASDPDARAPLAHSMEIATHSTGILDSGHAGDIMIDRAGALSVDPSSEAVLLIAHGMGDEAANDRVLASMRRVADRLDTAGYADVDVTTLREDWEEKRVAAEKQIRDYVEGQSSERSVLVIPVRLSGFGPYATVLEGLAYRAGDGLLPHEGISGWVLETANGVSCASGWGPLTESCPRVVADSQVSERERN